VRRQVPIRFVFVFTGGEFQGIRKIVLGVCLSKTKHFGKTLICCARGGQLDELRERRYFIGDPRHEPCITEIGYHFYVMASYFCPYNCNMSVPVSYDSPFFGRSFKTPCVHAHCLNVTVCVHTVHVCCLLLLFICTNKCTHTHI
jgi:hypothetical protein